MASFIDTMSELVSMKFTYPKGDLSAHIYLMSGSLEQLQGIKVVLVKSVSTFILLASIHVPMPQPVKVAIKTLTEDDVKKEDVLRNLMEGQRSLNKSYNINRGQ